MDFLTWSSIGIALIFCTGYLCIIYEHQIGIHKAASALAMAGLCWLISCLVPQYAAGEFFPYALGKASEVCFFLFGALAIVEVMDSHHSFALITQYITATSPLTLLWIVGICTFFLSAILDNLTTTVVMVTLLQQLLPKGESRWVLGGAIVIAANAGGAWTPIGDVTTTMLWIGGQITAFGVIEALFQPSVACCIASFLILSRQLQKIDHTNLVLERSQQPPVSKKFYSKMFLFLGLTLLAFIPIIKTLTGLPPVMCMLLGVACMWLVTDWVHRDGLRESLRMPALLKRIDLPSILFFLGILLAVECLEMAGLLSGLAEWMEHFFPNQEMIAFAMGLISAVIDNVPLVAAAMKMYTLEENPAGSALWHSIAYAAGTGGSILIIGSAAGVAFMGMEGATFGWWLRRIAPAAFIGYITGFGLHLLLSGWTG